MRVDTELSEDDSKQVQNLANERGWQKPKAYTKVVRTGTDIEEQRNRIREVIVEFFEQEKQRHDERLESLVDRYNLEKHEERDLGAFEVKYNGHVYYFADPDELTVIDGDGPRDYRCPECGEIDTEFLKENMETDRPNNRCKNCGELVEGGRENYEYIVDKEDVEHVKEFGRKKLKVFSCTVRRLDDVLEGLMGRPWNEFRASRWESPEAGVYSYSNDFQKVQFRFWTTNKDSIEFQVCELQDDFTEYRDPVEVEESDFTDDYVRLLDEIAFVNQDAKTVTPLVEHDYTGNVHPELIEIVGVSEDDLELPLHRAGYELELHEKDEKAKAEEDDDSLPTSYIRITNS